MHRYLYMYDPVLGYRFIPGQRARVSHEGGGYLVRVNASGFRCNHDFRREKRPGVRRILLFGDSYAAGEGVSNGQRYSDLLESQVPNVEVYNFGLPGTGPDQQYLAYQHYAAEIDHDLLIIAVFVENIRRVVAHYRYRYDDWGRYVCYAKPYFEFVENQLVLRNVPVPKEPIAEEDIPQEEQDAIDRGARFGFVASVEDHRRTSWGEEKVMKKDPISQYRIVRSSAWQVMQAILTEWITSLPKPTIVMPHPWYLHVEEETDPSHYQKRFQELTTVSRCVLHDPLPDLLHYPIEERRRFRFAHDAHPSSQGHRAIALSLTPVVKGILL